MSWKSTKCFFFTAKYYDFTLNENKDDFYSSFTHLIMTLVLFQHVCRHHKKLIVVVLYIPVYHVVCLWFIVWCPIACTMVPSYSLPKRAPCFIPSHVIPYLYSQALTTVYPKSTGPYRPWLVKNELVQLKWFHNGKRIKQWILTSKLSSSRLSLSVMMTTIAPYIVFTANQFIYKYISFK